MELTSLTPQLNQDVLRCIVMELAQLGGRNTTTAALIHPDFTKRALQARRGTYVSATVRDLDTLHSMTDQIDGGVGVLHFRTLRIDGDQNFTLQCIRHLAGFTIVTDDF
jgi:hypothetical protein